MESSEDTLKNIKTESDYELYRPFIDYEWARAWAIQLKATPLRTPFAEMALAFKQAESLHCTPRLVVEVASRQLDGYMKGSANMDVKLTDMAKLKFLAGSGKEVRPMMQKRVIADIDSALTTALNCNPSIDEMEKILWDDLYPQKDFGMTIWHSQSMSYCSLVFAYEWFIVSVYRVLTGDNDTDPRGNKDTFWKNLTSLFNYEMAFFDYWDNDQIWLARTIRHKTAHTGGRYFKRKNDREILAIEPRPIMSDGYFSIQPQDTIRLYKLLKDTVSSFVERVVPVLPTP